MASLVTTYGGRPVSAPSMREVPLNSNTEALAAAGQILRGEFDIVMLLTGVGTRALLDVVAEAHPRDAFIAALARAKVVARGPKPLAVLREIGVTPWVIAPEPNTWREVLSAVDATALSLAGQRIAVQEYGASPAELLEGLEARGAVVTRVPVYRWELPEDLQPLRDAIDATVRGELDVAIFTTSTQAVHLFKIAAAMGKQEEVRDRLRTMMIASIGPTTSDELREQGLQVDLEASHPKMGFLVREAAERSAELLRAKRG